MIEDKLKHLKNLRVQILILTVVGWAVAMAIDRTEVNKYRIRADNFFASLPIQAGVQPLIRTQGTKAALIVLAIIETLLFGFGIGFFVAVGFRVFKIKNSMLRRRMIWCWAAISYFMISWWPHSTAHSLILVSSTDPEKLIINYIAIEIAFHWTIMFCSLTLSYFQYDLILLMYEVAMMRLKMKEGKEVDPLKMGKWRNFKLHSLVILAVFFIVGMVVSFHYQPILTTYKPYQKFFYVTFKIVDSIILGCGFAFAYIICWIIYPLPRNSGRRVAIISSCCIFFLFLIQYPHPIIHGMSPPSTFNIVAIDFGVHIPIVIATSILAFYQFRMLELATDAKSSLSVAAQMRRKGAQTSSTGDVSMKSIESSSYGSGSSDQVVSKDSGTISSENEVKEVELVKKEDDNVVSNDTEIRVEERND